MSSAHGREPIVVGVDPDPSKRLALAWAADEADRRGLPVRLVHAQGVPTGGYRTGEALPSWEEWNRTLHEAGAEVLKEAVAFV
ncbi:universal stress protein, partial [Streptomyces sp. ADMS]